MMPKHTRRLEVFLALVLFACGCAAPQTPITVESVGAALTARYPQLDRIRAGELQFANATAVTPLYLPALSRALRGTRFFISHLRTGYYEYPELEIAVAMNRAHEMAVLHSPLYDKSVSEFCEVLKRSRATGKDEALAVAREIARMFALITYRGDLASEQFEIGMFAADLWHDDMLCGTIRISFDQDRLASVRLEQNRWARMSTAQASAWAPNSTIRQIYEQPDSVFIVRGFVIELRDAEFAQSITPDVLKVIEAKHGGDVTLMLKASVNENRHRLTVELKPGRGDFGTGNSLMIAISRSALVGYVSQTDPQWEITCDEIR